MEIEINNMNTIIYIAMLVMFFWIVGWAFNKNTDKSLSFVIYFMALLGGFACLGAVWVSIGKPEFRIVAPFVIMYSMVITILFIPKA